MKKRNPQRIKDRLWGGIPVRIILPVSLTVILFGLTIFLLLLPLIEKKLMDGKREMIRELTESSWSILAAHAQEERDGLLTRQKAQASAIENLRRLRYGPELKDYFWINDMHPRIVMHPYRPDLEGKDISVSAIRTASVCSLNSSRLSKPKAPGTWIMNGNGRMTRVVSFPRFLM